MKNYKFLMSLFATLVIFSSHAQDCCLKTFECVDNKLVMSFTDGMPTVKTFSGLIVSNIDSEGNFKNYDAWIPSPYTYKYNSDDKVVIGTLLGLSEIHGYPTVSEFRLDNTIYPTLQDLVSEYGSCPASGSSDFVDTNFLSGNLSADKDVEHNIGDFYFRLDGEAGAFVIGEDEDIPGIGIEREMESGNKNVIKIFDGGSIGYDDGQIMIGEIDENIGQETFISLNSTVGNTVIKTKQNLNGLIGDDFSFDVGGGVLFQTNSEFRISNNSNFKTVVGRNELSSTDRTDISADTELYLSAEDYVDLRSGDFLEVNSSGRMKFQALDNMNIITTGQMNINSVSATVITSEDVQIGASGLIEIEGDNSMLYGSSEATVKSNGNITIEADQSVEIDAITDLDLSASNLVSAGSVTNTLFGKKVVVNSIDSIGLVTPGKVSIQSSTISVRSDDIEYTEFSHLQDDRIASPQQNVWYLGSDGKLKLAQFQSTAQARTEARSRDAEYSLPAGASSLTMITPVSSVWDIKVYRGGFLVPPSEYTVIGDVLTFLFPIISAAKIVIYGR